MQGDSGLLFDRWVGIVLLAAAVYKYRLTKDFLEFIDLGEEGELLREAIGRRGTHPWIGSQRPAKGKRSST